MAKYRLTKKAVDDLDSIWNYTLRTWSEKQADEYYNSLTDTFQSIADLPCSLDREYTEIHSGLYRRQCRKHLIFYRLLRDGEMLEGEDKAREQFTQDFINDIIGAKYSSEVEEGMLQLCEDLASGKVEMRIDKSKNLHAKFYLCLPENHNEDSDGWVIMGS